MGSAFAELSRLQQSILLADQEGRLDDAADGIKTFENVSKKYPDLMASVEELRTSPSDKARFYADQMSLNSTIGKLRAAGSKVFNRTEDRRSEDYWRYNGSTDGYWNSLASKHEQGQAMSPQDMYYFSVGSASDPASDFVRALVPNAGGKDDDVLRVADKAREIGARVRGSGVDYAPLLRAHRNELVGAFKDNPDAAVEALGLLAQIPDRDRADVLASVNPRDSADALDFLRESAAESQGYAMPAAVQGATAARNPNMAVANMRLQQAGFMSPQDPLERTMQRDIRQRQRELARNYRTASEDAKPGIASQYEAYNRAQGLWAMSRAVPADDNPMLHLNIAAEAAYSEAVANGAKTEAEINKRVALRIGTKLASIPGMQDAWLALKDEGQSEFVKVARDALKLGVNSNALLTGESATPTDVYSNVEATLKRATDTGAVTGKDALNAKAIMGWLQNKKSLDLVKDYVGKSEDELRSLEANKALPPRMTADMLLEAAKYAQNKVEFLTIAVGGFGEKSKADYSAEVGKQLGQRAGSDFAQATAEYKRGRLSASDLVGVLQTAYLQSKLAGNYQQPPEIRTKGGKKLLLDTVDPGLLGQYVSEAFKLKDERLSRPGAQFRYSKSVSPGVRAFYEALNKTSKASLLGTDQQGYRTLDWSQEAEGGPVSRSAGAVRFAAEAKQYGLDDKTIATLLGVYMQDTGAPLGVMPGTPATGNPLGAPLN